MSGITRSVKLFVENSCEVSGRVVDAVGKPVDAAELWLVDVHEVASSFQVSASHADGRFEIHGVKPSSVKVFARKSGFASSARKFVRTNEGGKFEVELALRGPEAAIEGIVHDERGEPIAGAMILVGTRYESPASAPLNYRPTIIEGMPARSDERGHFALDGMLPGPAWIDSSALGFKLTREAIDLAPGPALHHDVLLSPGATLHGIVQHANGTPIEEATVTVRNLATDLSQSADTDATGAYRLEGLEVGDSRVIAQYSDTERLEANLTLQTGQDATWNAKLEGGLDLFVRVLDESGKPTKKVSVRIECSTEGREPFMRGGTAEKDGRFRIKGCPDVAGTVTVYPEHSQLFPVAVVTGVRPGGPELVVHLDPAIRPSIYFTGRVVGPDGKALAASTLTPENDALGYAAGELSKENGSFRIGPFPTGRWSLEVAHEGFASFFAKERDLAADSVWDLGTIQLTAGDPIEIDLIYPSEAQHYPPWITVHNLDTGAGEWCKVEGDRGRTPPLAPGRYELRLEGAYAALTQTTEVIAGCANKVTLALNPGIAFAIQLSGAEPGVHTTITVTDAAGKFLMERSPPIKKVDAFKFPACLAAGHYRIEVADAKQRKNSLDFDVDASTAQKTIEISLR